MTYHITPINDIKDHQESTTCNCKPDAMFENGHMLVIHHSYDKREEFEKLKEVSLN